MKSKRAREAATETAEDVLLLDGDALAEDKKKKKRKRGDDEPGEQAKTKKAKKKDKKGDVKETRREKKDKRKNLQDLPEEDASEEKQDGGAAAPEAEDTKKTTREETAPEEPPEQTDKKPRRKKKKTSAPETEGGAGADDDAGKKDRHIVFVGNLPFSATAASIKAHFASLKPISVRCLTNKGDAKPCKGIAFVEFANVWSMRTCLDKFHHSLFEDGVSAARKINVELTAGGGGSTQFRKDKIRDKNIKLDENRAKRIDKEKSAKQDGGKEAERGTEDDPINVHYTIAIGYRYPEYSPRDPTGYGTRPVIPHPITISVHPTRDLHAAFAPRKHETCQMNEPNRRHRQQRGAQTTSSRQVSKTGQP
ncbi:hypothetical protein E4U42_001103 [Claviceps africana]|uniref:RRM domain-containing protein n=1 Tax=Claviceps africana TaxID=83212 RepID=A0A8K0NI72_9HYPO|nr:hypothetical protein E4U42_001103 [Claviceps africana]